jgi:5-amino-6-(5-phospho-D-ribitylamino)uracil phosphatase
VASVSMIARTWFVSDLDGTLLGPGAMLSEYSRHALRSLIADGLLFTVATARTAPSIRALLGDLALPLPVIELNGAFVSDLATGRHLMIHALPSDVAAAVMARIRRRGLSAFIATSRDDEDHLYHAELPNPAMVWYRDEKLAFGDPRLRAIGDPCAALDEQVVGFTLLAERDALLALATDLRAELADHVQIHLFENLYCPGWWELSIQDRQATKSGAIAKLRRSLDLASRRLVVFGDGINDLDMFQGADHAVAVENAVPEIVAIAGEIAARNDQDGVVRWIAAARIAGRL